MVNDGEKRGQHLGLQSVQKLILLPSLKNFFAASPTSCGLVGSSITNPIVVWLATFKVTYKRQIKLMITELWAVMSLLFHCEIWSEQQNEGKNLSVIVVTTFILHRMLQTWPKPENRAWKILYMTHRVTEFRQGCEVTGSVLVMWKVLVIVPSATPINYLVSQYKRKIGFGVD